MPRVSFTRNLQRHVPCPDIEVEGRTLREVLENTFIEYPKLRGYILNDQGGLHKHMAIMVDNQATLDRDKLVQPVDAHAEIYVMQALSGG